MLKAIAERLSRSMCFRYRLPLEFGGCRMFVTPEAGLRYWFPGAVLRRDKNMLKNAAEWIKPGSVVWDVGANMGLFSFMAAGLSGPKGRVYAFEPDAVMIRLLRRSARLNPQAAPVEVIPCAVGASVSLARFNIANHNRAASFLEGFGTGLTGGVRETQTVLTVPLDWIAEHIPAPDVLKIDVEGAELQVFLDAACMLNAKRPVIIYEAQMANGEEIGPMLRKLGYALYNADLPPTPGERPMGTGFSTLAVQNLESPQHT
jgi:FkbM family methyltransferase